MNDGRKKWIIQNEQKGFTAGLKVSRSSAKIDENFANYFLKTKANNKCLIVLKCTYKGLQKSIIEFER